MRGRAIEVEADSEILPRVDAVGEFAIAVVARVLVKEQPQHRREVIAVTRRPLVQVVDIYEWEIETSDDSCEVVFVFTEVAGLLDHPLCEGRLPAVGVAMSEWHRLIVSISYSSILKS